MKKIILIFLSFSFCNHNPTRSEIEAGKNKWKRPKKIPPSDTVQMSGKWSSLLPDWSHDMLFSDIVSYTLPAGYEEMVISGYQMRFPVAKAFCDERKMSLPVPENEEVNHAIHKLSIDNVGKCMVTKGLGIGLQFLKVWIIQYESYFAPVKSDPIDDIWLGIKWDLKTDSWRNIYTNETLVQYESYFIIFNLRKQNSITFLIQSGDCNNSVPTINYLISRTDQNLKINFRFWLVKFKLTLNMSSCQNWIDSDTVW